MNYGNVNVKGTRLSEESSDMRCLNRVEYFLFFAPENEREVGADVARWSSLSFKERATRSLSDVEVKEGKVHTRLRE